MNLHQQGLKAFEKNCCEQTLTDLKPSEGFQSEYIGGK
jgi:hypothetical protein